MALRCFFCVPILQTRYVLEELLNVDQMPHILRKRDITYNDFLIIGHQFYMVHLKTYGFFFFFKKPILHTRTSRQAIQREPDPTQTEIIRSDINYLTKIGSCTSYLTETRSYTCFFIKPILHTRTSRQAIQCEPNPTQSAIIRSDINYLTKIGSYTSYLTEIQFYTC